MRYFSTFISGLRQFKSKLIEIVETGQSYSREYGLHVLWTTCSQKCRTLGVGVCDI